MAHNVTTETVAGAIPAEGGPIIRVLSRSSRVDVTASDDTGVRVNGVDVAPGPDGAYVLVLRRGEPARVQCPASSRLSICTALRLQQRFASHGDDPTPLWVRMGVHWGRPLRRGDDIIGRDVNLASRIAGLASAGEVLCSGTVVDAAGALPDAMFCSLGSVFVKGVADPIPLFRADITSRTT